jgi:hypothetical protein
MRRATVITIALLASAFIAGGLLLASEHVRTSPLFLQEATAETNGAGERQSPEGENFRGFRFGAPLSEFTNIHRVRPNSILIENDERTSEFYSPGWDIQIGDFTVCRSDFYLIFYKDRLARIRVVNSFRAGIDDQDYRFFSALRAALTQKYGKVQSSEPEHTRFDGRYTWTTDTLRIVLTYTLLEYAWLDIEREMQREFRTPIRINSTDL